ncbi:MAG TPA: TatD family hydrolase [Syntrophorhabdaceae bacterium]|nr:TatD family hydrolase [Syntrophorhabdaceae bacterium]
MFADSHCHLEMESYDEDRGDVIKQSVREGLHYMLTVGTEEAYFNKVIEIIDGFPMVYGALGIHPHNSNAYGPDVADKIRHLAAHPKIVAYGEIGLDYFKNHSPREAQIKAFRQQLELAQTLGLPIIVHSRDAREETYAILKEASANECGGVIHCYSYDLDYVKKFLHLGFYISIPGTITYTKAQELQKVVQYVPDDRLLAETDAPFLTPSPHRGKRNVPSYVKLTIEKIAFLRGKDLEELGTVMCHNFEKLFLKTPKGKRA